MSGEGPESIPTSADPRSKRPTKRRAMSPGSRHAADIESLLSKPDQPVRMPNPSGKSSKQLQRAIPEIVTNVQGSSAGAGSGEFHVYKASRRREYERLRAMDEANRSEKEQEEFEKQRDENAARDDERTRRNREKREKAKARKAKGKKDMNGGGGGGGAGNKAPLSRAGNNNSNGSAEKTTTKEDESAHVAAAARPGSKVAPRAATKSDGANGDEGNSANLEAAAPEPQGIVIEDD